tara:strand:+ start:3371 stop:3544 length:174 start_codon:yes stop_codon:yes gene_type:complete
MKVGEKVIHREFPHGPAGRVVAKTKKWGHALPTFLVRWDGDGRTSRHIEGALQKVNK